MDARRRQYHSHPRQYRPPQHTAYKPTPLGMMPVRPMSVQRPPYMPVIPFSSQRYFQQTTTEITTVGEYPLETITQQSSSKTGQIEESKPPTPLVQSSASEEAIEPMEKDSGQDIGTSKSLTSVEKATTSTCSQPIGLVPKTGTSTLATNDAVLRAMEERSQESLSPLKSPFVDLSSLKRDGLKHHQQKRPRRAPLLPGGTFISLDVNKYTEKRVHPSLSSFTSHQKKATDSQQVTRPVSHSAPDQQESPTVRQKSVSLSKSPRGKLPPTRQAPLSSAKLVQEKIASTERTQTTLNSSPRRKKASPNVQTLSKPTLHQKRAAQITRPFSNFSPQKKAAPNQRISRVNLNSNLGLNKKLPDPRTNRSISNSAPHSKKMRPNQQTAQPLPSSSTPGGQKDQPSRTMPRQKKISPHKHVSPQKKAIPNQQISRVNLNSRLGEKKIPANPSNNRCITGSAPHPKDIRPGQQATPPLPSRIPRHPTSSTPHRKKITPSQQPKSSPTSSKMKISPNQQTSSLLSNSLQNKTTSRPLMTNVTNHKKRKTPAPFSPPGDFISLDTTEPPHKKAKTAFQEESLDQKIAVSVERYFSEPPYTLTESRRLFMKDKGSSAIYDFFLQNQQSEVFLKKKQNLTSALGNVIREKMIPNCKMFLVGSSVNGFGSLTSDIDLCLVLDAEQETLTSRKRVLNLLRDIQRLLQRAAFAKNLQVIPAKVPILKFKDALSGLHCDINVNNLTGIRNSELLRCYSNLDHRVRPLVLVVKEWARQNKINDASQGTLSSYSLVLMVIHFLQCGVQPRLLPPLQQKYPQMFTTRTPVLKLREKTGRINPIRSENKMALFDLLLQFFEYFGRQFDFETQVICVRLGTTRHVRNFQGFAKEWTKAIKIEEPFERSNTARAVGCPVTARKIFQKFRIAYDTLRTRRRLDCLIKLRKSRDSVIVLDD